MEQIIALSLLVAVAAWMVASFARLEHLNRRVQQAWKKWNHATRRRNDCLGDFVTVYASYLPREDMLPRKMRRWAEDSRRALEELPHAPMLGSSESLGLAEKHLQRLLRHTRRLMESNPPVDANEQLLGLYQAMSVSLRMQVEEAHYYNRSVHDYNAALDEPITRLVAPLLGFAPVDELAQLSPLSKN